MNRKILMIFAGLLGLLPGGLFAQFGLQVSHLKSSSPISQRWQPANILNSEASFAYAADGQGWLQNSAFSLKGVLSNNLYWSEDTRLRMVDQAKNGGAITAGLNLGLVNINANIKGRVWSFFLDHKATLGASFKNGETLGLILLGNKPYRGQTVTDDNINFSRLTTREIGAGTGFDLGKLKLGVRVKFVQGFRLRQLRNTSLSLFTAQDGTQIDINANYDYAVMKQTTGLNPFSFQGFGGGVDLGVRYEIKEGMNLTGAITDLGFVAWSNMDKYKADVNLEFEGISVANLFADSLGEQAEAAIDTLMDALVPDSTSGSVLTPSGMVFRVGLEYKLGEKGWLYPEIIYAPFKQGAFTRLPLINVAYQHNINDWLTLGANAFGGGTNNFGIGLMADMDFVIGSNVGLNVNINSDAILGAVVPAAAGGVSVYGGVGFYLLETGDM